MTLLILDVQPVVSADVIYWNCASFQLTCPPGLAGNAQLSSANVRRMFTGPAFTLVHLTIDILAGPLVVPCRPHGELYPQ